MTGHIFRNELRDGGDSSQTVMKGEKHLNLGKKSI